MAKLFFSFVYCIFFLSIALPGKLVVVEGADCSEDLGTCDADCFARCKVAHPNGRGSCAGPEICRCLFSCKTCKENIRLGGCVQTQCQSDCVAKHPNRNASGYCVYVGVPSADSCFCEYSCWRIN